MAKKRTETNLEMESKGAKSVVRKNQSTPNPQIGEGNGAAEARVTTTPLTSGFSTLEFNARVARKAYALFEAGGGMRGATWKTGWKRNAS